MMPGKHILVYKYIKLQASIAKCKKRKQKYFLTKKKAFSYIQGFHIYTNGLYIVTSSKGVRL